MKKIIAALAIAATATAVYAGCRSYSYTINGKTYYCTECCFGEGNARQCNTTCN